MPPSTAGASRRWGIHHQHLTRVEGDVRRAGFARRSGRRRIRRMGTLESGRWGVWGVCFPPSAKTCAGPYGEVIHTPEMGLETVVHVFSDRPENILPILPILPDPEPLDCPEYRQSALFDPFEDHNGGTAREQLRPRLGPLQRLRLAAQCRLGRSRQHLRLPPTRSGPSARATATGPGPSRPCATPFAPSSTTSSSFSRRK